MTALDGKKRKIQMSDTEGILRIIQSIPSPKAEPFKRWLAKVGMSELKGDMNKAGNVLNKAKEEIEKELERPVLTSENYLDLTNKREYIENK